jgi:DNA-directed RNA polymerase specialized sigma24 family protein
MSFLPCLVIHQTERDGGRTCDITSAACRAARSPGCPSRWPTTRAPDPVTRAERADTLSLAFLALLERLSPLERAAFVPREVFDYDYRQIAAILERSAARCRRL